MIQRILTVGGFTLVSRATGFIRDIILAAVLGAGPLADAFFVALRLPNHFRAIFAEGAFNAAFVPAYAHIREKDGVERAKSFADKVFAMLLASQVVLLVIAVGYSAGVVGLLAPGLAKDPERFAAATELTRITFPYLLLVTLVTLYGGILNALNRFAAAAAAPILFNLSMIVALMLAAFFPSAGHAAAWGVLIAGILEALLVGADAARAGVLPKLRWPSLDVDVRQFFRALGPATLGSAGVQLALFADTIIASFLVTGALSALYYADRINQLPIGVIGIAIGTVILPEMSRRIAAGDGTGAAHAQNRAVELALLLAVPCVAAFVAVPEQIMRALFVRGAFTAADAQAAGATLAAYAIGLIPFVLVRTVTATFLARRDTATPVKAALAAAAINIALKFALVGALAQVGLALATSVGAWINVAIVVALAWRSGLAAPDRRLLQAVWKLAIAGGALAAALYAARPLIASRLDDLSQFRDEFGLLALMGVGAVVYGLAIVFLFGPRWFGTFRTK